MGELAKWRNEKWVRIGTDGSIKGACGTSKNKKNPCWFKISLAFVGKLDSLSKVTNPFPERGYTTSRQTIEYQTLQPFNISIIFIMFY